MYVCVSRSETGGRLWNVAINRILMGVVSFETFQTIHASKLIHSLDYTDPHARVHGSINRTSIKMALCNFYGTCCNRCPRLQIPSRSTIRQSFPLVHPFGTRDGGGTSSSRRCSKEQVTEAIRSPFVTRTVVHSDVAQKGSASPSYDVSLSFFFAQYFRQAVY